MSGLSISIVTPSFNQGAFVKEALESVQTQSYPCLEHLVMDGGSTDDTQTILEACSCDANWGHLIWCSKKDNGQSDALNKGFSAAKGDIIGWLNSDDRYRPECFKTVAQAFTRYPDVDVVYGDYVCVTGSGEFIETRREIEFSPFVLYYHCVLYIPTPSTFFRRRIFAEGNYLNESLNYAMDYEFFVRLARRGYRFKHIPNLLADFRIHDQSKTGSASSRQLEEHNQIARQYSPAIIGRSNGLVSDGLFGAARMVAAGRRYSEKLLRGYYGERLIRAVGLGLSESARR